MQVVFLSFHVWIEGSTLCIPSVSLSSDCDIHGRASDALVQREYRGGLRDDGEGDILLAWRGSDGPSCTDREPSAPAPPALPAAGSTGLYLPQDIPSLPSGCNCQEKRDFNPMMWTQAHVFGFRYTYQKRWGYLEEIHRHTPRWPYSSRRNPTKAHFMPYLMFCRIQWNISQLSTSVLILYQNFHWNKKLLSEFCSKNLIIFCTSQVLPSFCLPL